MPISKNSITLDKRNIPFAQILPITRSSSETVEKRRSLMGSLRGKVKIIGDITQPLTKKKLEEWYKNNLSS
ncbi:MAG TPA: hypothetical protein VLF89_05595 [Candidatus Saccharimonadales bacterium]|nr:hypothetical protein [Candidatus Saccharimonadales bacterium]